MDRHRQPITPYEKTILFRFLLWNFANGRSVNESVSELGFSPKTVELRYRQLRELLFTKQSQAPVIQMRGRVGLEVFRYNPQYSSSPRIQRPALVILMNSQQMARVIPIGARRSSMITPLILEHVLPSSTLRCNGSRIFDGLLHEEFKLEQTKIGNQNIYSRALDQRDPMALFVLGLQSHLGSAHGITTRTFNTRVQEYVFRWNSRGWSDLDRFRHLFHLWESVGMDVIRAEQEHRRVVKPKSTGA